jgi:tetratricopeptide (TPR) repeat protein
LGASTPAGRIPEDQAESKTLIARIISAHTAWGTVWSFSSGCRKFRLFQAGGEQRYAAQNEYRDVLALAPEDPAVLRQLGVIYFEQGQLRQACFKRSAELQPDDADIQLKLGTLADAFDLWRVQGIDLAAARAALLLQHAPGQARSILAVMPSGC